MSFLPGTERVGSFDAIGRRARPLGWLLATLLCTTGNVAASTSSESALPEPGTRIRLTARMPERQRWTGTFVSIANDTVTMRVGDTQGGLLALHTRNVSRFEISRGIRSNAVRGAGVGLVVGALAGATVGYYAGDQSTGPGPGAYSLLGAVAFGLVGATLGALGPAPSEKWREVPLNDLRSTASP